MEDIECLHVFVAVFISSLEKTLFKSYGNLKSNIICHFCWIARVLTYSEYRLYMSLDNFFFFAFGTIPGSQSSGLSPAGSALRDSPGGFRGLY